MKITLTEDQQVAVDLVKNFLNSDQEVFTLSGIGGGGKTTCIREALKGVSNVVGATVSHSAKFVLSQSLNGIAKCVTIAQLLGLRMVISEDGEISFAPNINRGTDITLLVESADVLVIDECSMIDPTTKNLILNLKNSTCKVIFLGERLPR